MNDRSIRALAFVCAFMLAASAAPVRAEFSPQWEALSRCDAVTLTVTGAVTEAPFLADSSLAALNGWLDKLQAMITLNLDGGWRIRARYQDADVLDVQCEKRDGGAATFFGSSGRTYLTGRDQPDALALLTETGDGLMDYAALTAFYPDLAAALFETLAEAAAPKTVREKTSIQYALSSPVYENYAFPDGSLNEIWSKAAQAMLPAAEKALENAPVQQRRVRDILPALTFSGNCQIKRFLDAEGKDMGLQFTGRCGAGEARKASLTYGFTPGRGGTLTVQWNTSEGSVKLTAGGRLTENKNGNELTVKGSLTQRDGKNEETSAWDVKLESTVRDGTETWTGKAVVSSTVNGAKTEWTLIPALTLDGNEMTGSVEIRIKAGKKLVLKATLRVTLSEDLPSALPQIGETIDLRALGEVEARALAAAELIPLTGVSARLMASLPQDIRNRLTHDLRTDEWMTGPSVAAADTDLPQEEEIDDAWVVEEEE